MKNCSEISQLVSVYLDDEMDNKERIEFEEHLKNCEQCRTEVDEIREVINLCRDADEVELPNNFKEELHRRLVEVSNEEKRKSKIIASRSRYIKAFSSIAAALILVFAAKGLYDNGYFSPAIYNSTASSAGSAQAPQALSDMTAESAKAHENDAGDQVSIKFAEDTASDSALMAKDTNRSNGSEERKLKSGESDRNIKKRFVDITLYSGAGSDIKQQEENVKTFALENGAELTEPEISGFAATFTLRAVPAGKKDEKDEKELNIKVPTSKYQWFIDELTAKFGKENVLVGETETVDMNTEMESYNIRLTELDKMIKDMESGGEDSDDTSLNEAKSERDAVQAEIERIELDSKYTFIKVLVKARQ